MLRLFSIFPSRGPGVALLLLRISVASMVLTDASGPLSALAPPLVFGGLALVALALCIGLATPLAAVLTCLFQLAGLLAGDQPTVGIGASMLNSAALALLGPGAYSMDARLFGRREIILPQSDRSGA